MVGSLSAFFGNLEPTCSQGRFRRTPWHHFGWFWMDFAWILMDFGIIFQCILDLFAIRFVDCPRLTRSELTATFEKMPRTAKNWQKAKANERRPPNYTLQHAVHETRSTETNASNNTGSAVLAPHGALGSNQKSNWAFYYTAFFDTALSARLQY